MKDIITIKQGLGICDLLFGATTTDAELLFGKPDEIDVIEEIENFESTVYHYWDNGFSLFFDNSNPKLFSCAEVDNESAILWEQKIFSFSQRQIIDLLSTKGYKEFEEEMHEWGEKRLSFENAGIDFYFEKNKLISVNFGKPILPQTTIIHSN